MFITNLFYLYAATGTSLSEDEPCLSVVRHLGAQCPVPS